MRYFWDTLENCVPPETILAALARAGFADMKRNVIFGIFREYTTGMIGARKDCPVLLFDSIKGYPKGWRLMTNIFNHAARQKLIYGCPPEIGDSETMRWWNAQVKTFQPEPPVFVNDAPVKQNVKQGKEVNLKVFPWARWHEKDGGPYMCATATVTREPESGYVNVGSYRFKLIDENTANNWTDDARDTPDA